MQCGRTLRCVRPKGLGILALPLPTVICTPALLRDAATMSRWANTICAGTHVLLLAHTRRATVKRWEALLWIPLRGCTPASGHRCDR